MPQFADLQSVTVGDFKLTCQAHGVGFVVPKVFWSASMRASGKKCPVLLDDEDN